MHIACNTSQSMPASMSLDEKIGQLLCVAAVSNIDINKEFIATQPYKMEPDYIKHIIRDYHVGGVIFLGSGFPHEQRALTKEFQAISKHQLLIVQDCEWGPAMRLRTITPFPKAMALGALALENNHLIYECGKEIGRQCKVLGIHCALGPVADVNNNPKNPIINDRSFGEHAERVAHKALLYMQGMRDAGIMSCAKHFPGHGDTVTDSHYGLPLISHDRARLNAVELYPFKKLIAAGIPCIMTAHIAVPTLTGNNFPTSISRTVTTGILRNEYGFNGIIVTDGLGMKGITDLCKPGDIEVQALLAGNDMLLCPVDIPAAHAAIKKAVIDGTISMQELNEHVLRILRAKEWTFKNACTIPLSELETPHTHHLLQNLYNAALTTIGAPSFTPLTKKDSCVIVHITNEKEPLAIELTPYATITSISVPPTIAEREQINLINRLANYSYIIISIHSLTRFAREQFGITPALQALVDRICTRYENTCGIIFGNPYSYAYFKHLKRCLIAYDNSTYAQHAVAQTLFGALHPTGVAPVSI